MSESSEFVTVMQSFLKYYSMTIVLHEILSVESYLLQWQCIIWFTYKYFNIVTTICIMIVF